MIYAKTEICYSEKLRCHLSTYIRDVVSATRSIFVLIDRSNIRVGFGAAVFFPKQSCMETFFIRAHLNDLNELHMEGEKARETERETASERKYEKRRDFHDMCKVLVALLGNGNVTRSSEQQLEPPIGTASKAANNNHKTSGENLDRNFL